MFGLCVPAESLSLNMKVLFLSFIAGYFSGIIYDRAKALLHRARWIVKS